MNASASGFNKYMFLSQPVYDPNAGIGQLFRCWRHSKTSRSPHAFPVLNQPVGQAGHEQLNKPDVMNYYLEQYLRVYG